MQMDPVVDGVPRFFVKCGGDTEWSFFDAWYYNKIRCDIQ